MQVGLRHGTDVLGDSMDGAAPFSAGAGRHGSFGEH